jgi:hypothetical protein
MGDGRWEMGDGSFTYSAHRLVFDRYSGCRDRGYSSFEEGLLLALRINCAIVRESESPDSSASFSNFSRSTSSRDTFSRFFFVVTAQKWSNCCIYCPTSNPDSA